MTQPRVFISMGTPYSPEFEQFRDALEAFLRDSCGVDPRIIGKNEYPDGNPLSKIRDVMSSCSGVIVVAYERKFVERGSEKRTGSSPKLIEGRTYTTPWNHIESAMAYSMGLPLYVLCQNGLAEEGLIEAKSDWYVQYVDISHEALRRMDVQKSIRAWIDGRVLPFRKKKQAPFLLGNLKFSEMTPSEILSLGGTVAAIFAAGAAAAALFPKLFS